MGIIDGQAWEHTYPDDVRKVKEEEHQRLSRVYQARLIVDSVAANSL